jgi:hypothetical protein
MTRTYLAIPATSTPCERLFSKTKLFLDTNRARILPQTAKESVLLYFWMKLYKKFFNNHGAGDDDDENN